jgi:ribose/xylose/arabinose/galactoside ABC-type transport system permease subunit
MAATEPPSADLTTRTPAGRPVRRHARNGQLFGVYGALAVMWVFLIITAPYFFTSLNILSIFVSASTVSLISAGLTIVLIAGEIDLSFAAMEAFVGSIVALLIVQPRIPWPLAIVIGLAIGAFAGMVSGFVTVVARLPTFITTLAMMGILQGTAFLLTNNMPVTGFPDSYAFIGTADVGPIPVALFIVAIAYAALWFMLNHTVFGLHIYAVGGNRAAAAAVGISFSRVVIGVLVVCAFTAAISGIILTSRLGAGSGAYGSADLLPAIAGVIIGGTSLSGGVGTLAGTFGGIMIIETINDGLTLLNVSQFWQQIAVGVIIMLAVIVDQVARGYLNARWLSSFRESLKQPSHGPKPLKKER